MDSAIKRQDGSALGKSPVPHESRRDCGCIPLEKEDRRKLPSGEPGGMPLIKKLRRVDDGS